MAATAKSREPDTIGGSSQSRLRLRTIIRLRWLAVIGQLIALGVVWLGLGFELPIGYCLMVVALSAWLNVWLAIQFPIRHRLSTNFATILLAYDILQLAWLLYLTGGIENPFTMLLLVPVTVSAATLPPRNTILLGLLAGLAAWILIYEYWPLPWYKGLRLELPYFYKISILVALGGATVFLAFYVWRLADEGRQMSTALSATELILAREQKLHALDGLAAAAAHELGTPLSTIVLISRELEKEMPEGSSHREDLQLLTSQALRCREILSKLTNRPSETDPMHASLSISELLDEAANPYQQGRTTINIICRPEDSSQDDTTSEPVGIRRPGVIFGLGNIIENATDFAWSKVQIEATWNDETIQLTITDDGPGFKPELMDSLGEPYVTTRSALAHKRDGARPGGLGLGFFIAKTLLERSGATLTFENVAAPGHGAIVNIVWERTNFEADRTDDDEAAALSWPARRTAGAAAARLRHLRSKIIPSS